MSEPTTGGLREEWGIRYNKPNTLITQTMIVKNRGTAEAAVRNGAPIDADNRRIVRRLVTDWEEVPNAQVD